MQRTAIHTITFTARCESGLHIGGSQDELAIGGSDSPVIKNPETRKPYIPGSSLKGKMRGELEKHFLPLRAPRTRNQETTKGKTRVEWEGELGKSASNSNNPCGCACEDCPICRVFGAHMNTKSELGPSRIIVRDGRLLQGGRIENKTENVINRQTGAAEHPRSNERVVEGTKFKMQIVLQVFDLDGQFSYTDDSGGSHQGDEALQAVVADGLKLVQMTGLGGGTSRGSGAVSFDDFKLDGKPWTHWSA